MGTNIVSERISYQVDSNTIAMDTFARSLGKVYEQAEHHDRDISEMKLQLNLQRAQFKDLVDSTVNLKK